MKKGNSTEEPEDLGIKIGSKEEAAWTRIRDTELAALEQNERGIIINKAVVKLAEKMIKETKFKET